MDLVSIELVCSRSVTTAHRGIPWLSITGTDPESVKLDSADRLPALEVNLEAAFVTERKTWWSLGRKLSAQPTSDVSHAAACASFGSDLGLMLAWVRLVSDLTVSEKNCVVICDDPWVYRALAALPGIRAKTPPNMFVPELRYFVRGCAARLKNAIRLAWTSFKTRGFASQVLNKKGTLIVYAHPQSRVDGFDAYFGDLLQVEPELVRLLHTDGPLERANELCADGRSASLHAFGNPCFALFRLPFVRWRPVASKTSAAHRWLIRRAAVLENSGAGPALNRWQLHCQDRWLDRAKPNAVAWPWENFAWERGLVRSARSRGIRSIGYQHTVVGPHHFNYSPNGNPDNHESLPDQIVCNGPAYRDDLLAFGNPIDRIVNGGAFRFKNSRQQRFDPKGPVFIPLSANLKIAKQQISAARLIARSGRKALLKPHPMYPIGITPEQNLEVTDVPFERQENISVMLYTTGASGLEGLLSGVPCVRLRLPDQISIDVLPEGVATPTTTIETVVSTISSVPMIEPLQWSNIYSSPDYDLWKQLLN